MAAVFVYGTLLADEVLNVLLHRVPSSKAALLHDYVRNRNYPAISYQKGDQVKGKVLFELTEKELYVLDEFEGDEYKKLVAEPSLLEMKSESAAENEENATGKAFVYVWRDPADENLYGDWDYEAWRIQELDSYIRSCREFISEL